MLELASQKAIIAKQTNDLEKQARIIAKQKHEIEKLNAEKNQWKMIKRLLPDSSPSSQYSPPPTRHRLDYAIVLSSPDVTKLSPPDATTSTPLQESFVKLASELQHEVTSKQRETSQPNANVDASSSTSSANEMTASLSYNNKAYVNAETTGNAGEFLGAVLEEMSSQGMLLLSNDKLITKSMPMRYSRNKQLLRNCIELAAFAGDPGDISLLVNATRNYADKVKIKTTAVKNATAAHNKMLEFENSSAEVNKSEKRPKQPLILALGTRIKEYKKRCWTAQGQNGKACDAKIIDLEELRSLEIAANPGTPDGNRSIRDYTIK
ncbi:hypothetical protein HJC23_003950 [Cyclotella cryptica]|uniref:Uncharacterized protein n=1 Tax=Cyclotella cryptica TaxID=29204 RepID=A0ABD3PUA1_9STRA